MTQCPWEEIQEFRSLGEFDQFVRWMDSQVASGAAQEVPVTAPYLDATTFTEKWFQHLGSGQTWRLVWPDIPFKGLFERVN